MCLKALSVQFMFVGSTCWMSCVSRVSVMDFPPMIPVLKTVNRFSLVPPSES